MSHDPFVDAVCGAVVAETVTTALVLFLLKPSNELRDWYRTLGLSAMTLDVLSLSLGAYAGLRFAPQNLAAQVVVALLVGVVHDLSFGSFVQSFPRGRSTVMDLFKRYAETKGMRIVLDDALMIAGAVVAARVLARVEGANALAALAAYVNLMLVHSF